MLCVSWLPYYHKIRFCSSIHFTFTLTLIPTPIEMFTSAPDVCDATGLKMKPITPAMLDSLLLRNNVFSCYGQREYFGWRCRVDGWVGCLDSFGRVLFLLFIFMDIHGGNSPIGQLDLSTKFRLINKTLFLWNSVNLITGYKIITTHIHIP